MVFELLLLFAQDDVADLKRQIQELSRRIEQIEKKQQEPPPVGVIDQALDKKPSGKELQTIFDEGFWFVGADDKLKIGASGQFDYRWFVPTSDGSDDTFVLRRARFYATGVLEHYWGYMLMARYDNFVPNLHFAWVESQHLPWLRFRMGLFKEPFSLEGLHSDAYWDFTERSMVVSNLLLLEDLGAMIYGKVWEDRIEYGVGAFTGRGRLGTDTNDDKDAVGRLVLVPFKTLDAPAIQKLAFGLSGSMGEQEESLAGNRFRTQGGTPLWTYATGVTHDGDLSRWGTDVEWIWGPASLKAEYLSTNTQEIRLAGASEDLSAGGVYVQATYLLTGEDKPRNRPVAPAEDFDPGAGKWGAFELAARYERFWLEQNLITRGFAAGIDGADAFTIGLNWYLNRHMKAAIDFEHVDFNDPLRVGGRFEDEENAILMRLQFEF